MTNELYKRVYDLLGEPHMLILATEELSELQKAICKYQRDKIKYDLRAIDEPSTEGCIDFIAGEIADVEIMTEQLKQAFKLEKTVELHKANKLDRLEARVNVYERQMRR